MINWKNLQKHSDWLGENLDRGFDMENYTSGDRRGDTPDEICGTGACSLGWAVQWCPPDIFALCVSEEDWGFDYDLLSSELFGLEYGELWNWLFSLAWATVDNTLLGAKYRIDYLIKRKHVPHWFDAEDIDSAEYWRGRRDD